VASSRRPTRSLGLTPGQARELKQSITNAKQWITVDAAIELIEKRLGTTTGYAQKLLKDARNSGEVRCINSDRFIDDPRNDLFFNKDDLIGWLDRHAPPTSKPATPSKDKVHHYRNPDDEALVKEGRRLIAKKRVTKSEAARQLADRATGGSFAQRVARLRRLF
jgi:hypothetical protein